MGPSLFDVRVSRTQRAERNTLLNLHLTTDERILVHDEEGRIREATGDLENWLPERELDLDVMHAIGQRPTIDL